MSLQLRKLINPTPYFGHVSIPDRDLMSLQQKISIVASCSQCGVSIPDRDLMSLQQMRQILLDIQSAVSIPDRDLMSLQRSSPLLIEAKSLEFQSLIGI